ncbi:PTS sugar transporter subunit IIA [bacterium]|nr:PTS sugar transporter subunit IIA [bacterium]
MNGEELLEFFRPECFIFDLQGETKKDILEELVKPLIDTGKIRNKHVLLETLLKRETLGSTGIGKNVALPHCRTLAISQICVVVGISQKGIDYNAIDKKKVKLFFLIVAPPQEKINQYLPLLGKIVEIVKDNKNRKNLLKTENYTDFMEIIQG